MRGITETELAEILAKHSAWLRSQPTEQRTDPLAAYLRRNDYSYPGGIVSLRDPRVGRQIRRALYDVSPDEDEGRFPVVASWLCAAIVLALVVAVKVAL